MIYWARIFFQYDCKCIPARSSTFSRVKKINIYSNILFRVLKLREEIVQTKKLGNDVVAFLILRKIDKDQLEDKLLEFHLIDLQDTPTFVDMIPGINVNFLIWSYWCLEGGSSALLIANTSRTLLNSLVPVGAETTERNIPS